MQTGRQGEGETGRGEIRGEKRSLQELCWCGNELPYYIGRLFKLFPVVRVRPRVKGF